MKFINTDGMLFIGPGSEWFWATLSNLPINAVAPILNFWERVGPLARRGHLDLQLLFDGGSAFYCQQDWVRLAPSIMKGRSEMKAPALGEHFEWLVGRTEAWARKAGVRLDDATQQAARRERSIAICEGSIRTFEALRAVTRVMPRVAPPAPPTNVAAAEN